MRNEEGVTKMSKDVKKVTFGLLKNHTHTHTHTHTLTSFRADSCSVVGNVVKNKLDIFVRESVCVYMCVCVCVCVSKRLTVQKTFFDGTHIFLP
jgi:hypothetical protein